MYLSKVEEAWISKIPCNSFTYVNKGNNATIGWIILLFYLIQWFFSSLSNFDHLFINIFFVLQIVRSWSEGFTKKIVIEFGCSSVESFPWMHLKFIRWGFHTCSCFERYMFLILCSVTVITTGVTSALSNIDKRFRRFSYSADYLTYAPTWTWNKLWNMRNS